jgi:hypothetical protein
MSLLPHASDAMVCGYLHIGRTTLRRLAKLHPGPWVVEGRSRAWEWDVDAWREWWHEAKRIRAEEGKGDQ